MVRLNLGGDLVARGLAFDDVWVECALREEIDLAQLVGLFLEEVNKFFADALPLVLRVGDAFQPAKESLRSVYVLKVHFEVMLEHLYDLLRLVAPEQAIVHEDAGELIADGLVDKHGGDG